MAKAMPRPAMQSQSTRIPELGRIRMGAKKSINKNGKEVTFPSALDTWRLTSPSFERLQAAVDLGWGSEVQPWQSPNGQQYELFTTLTNIDVVVPPWAAFSTNYERWGSNLLIRRCNGVEIISSGSEEDIGCPCICMNPEFDIEMDERCDLVTRLNVIISTLPGFGVWRFETLGYNSNAEMAGVVPLLESLSAQHLFVSCSLSIVSRSGRDRKTGQVRRYKIGTIQPKMANMLELASGYVRDEALALPRPQKPEPRQISQAMYDLGYDCDAPPVEYHKPIERTISEPEGNPYKGDGERSHIKAPSQGRDTETEDAAKRRQALIDDITGMCKRLINADIDPDSKGEKKKRTRTAIALLQHVFGEEYGSSDKIPDAIDDLEPGSLNPRLFSQCAATMLSEGIPGIGEKDEAKWKQHFESWFIEQQHALTVQSSER